MKKFEKVEQNEWHFIEDIKYSYKRQSYLSPLVNTKITKVVIFQFFMSYFSMTNIDYFVVAFQFVSQIDTYSAFISKFVMIWLQSCSVYPQPVQG